MMKILAALIAATVWGCGIVQGGESDGPELWVDDAGLHAVALPRGDCALVQWEPRGDGAINFSSVTADGRPVKYWLNGQVEHNGDYRITATLAEPVPPDAEVVVRIEMQYGPGPGSVVVPTRFAALCEAAR